MVGEADVVDRLLAMCPGFIDSKPFRNYVETDGDMELHYVVLGYFAEWVVQKVSSRNLECLDALFREVEALLKTASEDARQLIVIGFIEDLQDYCVLYPDASDRLDPDLILPLLGPKARSAWFHLIAYLWPIGGRAWPGIRDDVAADH
jgi:hypothetical protein